MQPCVHLLVAKLDTYIWLNIFAFFHIYILADTAKDEKGLNDTIEIQWLDIQIICILLSDGL